MITFSVLTTVAFVLLWFSLVGRLFFKKGPTTSVLSPAHNCGLALFVSVALILLVVSVWIFI